VKVRRFIAVDDCGTRINPMIIEGQVHGGLTDGVGMALMEMIAFDEDGNCLGGSLMDYLIPTALEVPDWETGFTVTPSPHHPIGAKGVGESATVGSPPAIVNAVVDALKPFGVRHADMPLTPSVRVWEARCSPRGEGPRARAPFPGRGPGVRHDRDRGPRHTPSHHRGGRVLVLRDGLPRPLVRGWAGHRVSGLFADADDVRRRLDEVGYLVDDGTATALFLATAARPAAAAGGRARRRQDQRRPRPSPRRWTLR
jgi:hypothetical protein